MDGKYIFGFGQSVEFRMVSLGICKGVLPEVCGKGDGVFWFLYQQFFAQYEAFI